MAKQFYLLGSSEFIANKTYAWIERELGYCNIHCDMKCSYYTWIQFIYFFSPANCDCDFFCQKEFQISPYQRSAAVNPALLTCISVPCDGPWSFSQSCCAALSPEWDCIDFTFAEKVHFLRKCTTWKKEGQGEWRECSDIWAEIMNVVMLVFCRTIEKSHWDQSSCGLPCNIYYHFPVFSLVRI